MARILCVAFVFLCWACIQCCHGFFPPSSDNNERIGCLPNSRCWNILLLLGYRSHGIRWGGKSVIILGLSFGLLLVKHNIFYQLLRLDDNQFQLSFTLAWQPDFGTPRRLTANCFLFASQIRSKIHRGVARPISSSYHSHTTNFLFLP